MTPTPVTFLNCCSIAGMDQSKACQIWQEVDRETYREFLTFLVTEIELSHVQMELLKQAMQLINGGKLSDEELKLEKLLLVLNEKQRGHAIDKLAKIYNKNIEERYDGVMAMMSMEQKQVVNAYIKTKHG